MNAPAAKAAKVAVKKANKAMNAMFFLSAPILLETYIRQYHAKGDYKNNTDSMKKVNIAQATR